MTENAELTKLAVDLGKVSSKVTQEVIKATAAAGREVASEAKSRAPRRSGALANSIVSHAKGLVAVVAADARHGAFQEFGTSRHGPQPFLGPALAAKKDAYVRRIEQIAGDIL